MARDDPRSANDGLVDPPPSESQAAKARGESALVAARHSTPVHGLSTAFDQAGGDVRETSRSRPRSKPATLGPPTTLRSCSGASD